MDIFLVCRADGGGDDRVRGERESSWKSGVILGWLRDTYCSGNRRKRTKAG